MGRLKRIIMTPVVVRYAIMGTLIDPFATQRLSEAEILRACGLRVFVQCIVLGGGRSMKAIKPVYDSKAKQYDILLKEVAEVEIGTYAGGGFMVFDDWFRLIGLVVTNKAFKDRPAAKAAVLRLALSQVRADVELQELLDDNTYIIQL